MATHRIALVLNLGEGKPLPSNVLGLLREDLLGTGVHVLVASVDSFDDGVLKAFAEVATEISDSDEAVKLLTQAALDEIYGKVEGDEEEDTDEDEKIRQAALDQFLEDHPLYEEQINEARISGSPLHLVAANIAKQEAARAAAASSSAEPTPETTEPAVEAPAAQESSSTETATTSTDSADTQPPKTGQN